MKKFLLSLVIGLLALVLIAYIASYFFLGSLVKTGVNTVGPRVTQTHVELADASLSPTGSGTLTGLAVANPTGWTDAHALYLGQVDFDVVPTSVLGDTIVINSLVIQQPELTYETRVVSSNIADLLKNIEASFAPSAPKPQQQDGPPKKFIVKHFKLTDGKVTLGVGPAALPLPLPALELHDLGVQEGGLTAGQLSVAVLRQVLGNVVNATTGAALKSGGTLGAGATEQLKKTGESLKKLFGGEKEKK
jgi:hypothetical protein